MAPANNRFLVAAAPRNDKKYRRLSCREIQLLLADEVRRRATGWDGRLGPGVFSAVPDFNNGSTTRQGYGHSERPTGSTKPPCWRRNSAISVLPCFIATRSGVVPYRVRALMFAPLARSNSAMSLCPPKAAACRGVKPPIAFTLTSALLAMSSLRLLNSRALLRRREE